MKLINHPISNLANMVFDISIYYDIIGYDIVAKTYQYLELIEEYVMDFNNENLYNGDTIK